MSKVLDVLGDAILSVGTSHFDQALHGFCKSILPSEYELCFIFPRKGRPRLSFVGTSEIEYFDALNISSMPFLDGGYSHVPAISSYGRRKALLIDRFTWSERENVPAAIESALNTRQVLTILTRIDGDICYLGFGLDEDLVGGGSIVRIERTARKYANILLRLVHRHDRLVTRNRLLKIAQAGWQNDPENVTNREEFIGLISEIFETRTSLSRKESEVCAHMVFGYSVDAIGMVFGISAHTISTHRKRAFAKLGISHQGALFAILHSMMNELPNGDVIALDS